MNQEIPIWPRTLEKKSEAKRLRREGMIPAIVYSRGKDEAIYLLKADFEAVIRSLKPGFLPTTIFLLKDSSGKARKAIVKDIQYKVTNYEVIHLDFQELHASDVIDVNVPIECLNQMDCVGVKAGGYLRQLIRHLKVRCLPEDLPSHFEVSVKELGLGQVYRVADISLTAKVNTLVKSREIVVTVAKR
jgi:large subunit ribosomal protein L25